ncbi:DUF4190 domain-containing protein [Prescottella defluvii]|uniref:DUF4190 domain-containing protein n=1 Tax=Prescottella defluvii TaxID=1323361 RepID=UPI0009DD1530|nr:DUF4190 domain-containing protein [Prescottella defluvii]
MELIFPVLILALVVGLVVATSSTKKKQPASSAPIGYTDTGQPIYQVVGYTSDGQPVTADRVVGGRPYSPRTNSLAVVALVLGLVVAPLAIPVGHVSRAQIKATGEQGSGMALAGLILGYLSLVGIVVLVAVLANP